jgi:SAM-dependent methyltransferase
MISGVTRDYLLDTDVELERLRLQSQVWEPAGRQLLARLPAGDGLRVLDVGCGSLSWLRLLSGWVGRSGKVVGTDIDDKLLGAARSFLDSEQIKNVELVRDDLFASKLESASFDAVHARFELAPLGRFEEQIAAHRQLLKEGGWLLLEEPETSSWRINPDGPATARLIEFILEAFIASGGDFNAGRRLPDLLRQVVGELQLDAHVVALPPGHPYLRVPLQFAASLGARLEAVAGGDELKELLPKVETEMSRPGTWGTTFTVIQGWGRVAGGVPLSAEAGACARGTVVEACLQTRKGAPVVGSPSLMPLAARQRRTTTGS